MTNKEAVPISRASVKATTPCTKQRKLFYPRSVTVAQVAPTHLDRVQFLAGVQTVVGDGLVCRGTLLMPDWCNGSALSLHLSGGGSTPSSGIEVFAMAIAHHGALPKEHRGPWPPRRTRGDGSDKPSLWGISASGLHRELAPPKYGFDSCILHQLIVERIRRGAANLDKELALLLYYQ